MIKDLLVRAEKIQKQNSLISSLKQETFNIFSIIRKGHEEEQLHSAFIGEMLSESGSHEMGKTFVKIFLEQILGSKFSLEGNIRVYLEKQIEQGRIDIYVENDNNQVLAIENKIYAGDQDKQLIRYANHLKNSNAESFELYYLNLDGTDPSQKSITSTEKALREGEGYSKITYRQEILGWMKLCLKEATEYPTLRETIKQYINLIKKLTGQLTDSKVEKEIQKEIKDNYKAAKLITENMWQVEANEVQLFINELRDHLLTQLSKFEEWEVEAGDVKEQWTGITIRHKKWGKDVWVKFEGQSRMAYNGSIYGIAAHNKLYDREEVKKKLGHIEVLKSGFRESEYWPFFKHLIYLGKSPEVDKLFDSDEREKLKNGIADTLVHLAHECKDPLISFEKKI